MTKKVLTCQTCGALAEEPGHLCSPSQEKTVCPYCGQTASHVKHYCQGKLDSLKYVCEKCGRLAPALETLCQPAAVPGD
jgi:hypothetical protein